MSDTLARQRQLIGTQAEWLADDLILGAGEIALERVAGGTVRARVGDGASPFSASPLLSLIEGAVSYRGNADPTGTPPPLAVPGDIYSAKPGGVVSAAWGEPAAGETVAEGDFLALGADGTWSNFAAAIDTAALVSDAELAAPGGAGLVGYNAGFASSLPEDIEELLRRRAVDALSFIDPALHPAIIAGTSVVDVAPQLNAALAEAKIIALPRVGRLSIGSTLFVPSGGAIIGVNYGSTIRALDGFADLPLIRNATSDPATLAARDRAIMLIGFAIDGNRAASLATEYSHGIHLNAVDGAVIDVTAADCKGDGLMLAYGRSLDGASAHYDVGCNDIRARVRVKNCLRMGVAMTCCEAFNIDVLADSIEMIGADIEPDQVASYVRNGRIHITAIGCGTSALSTTRGAVSITGTNWNRTGVCDVRDIVVTVDARTCVGNGAVFYRDVQNVTFRGVVDGCAGHGFYGMENNFGPSRVRAALEVVGATSNGMVTRGSGDTLFGTVTVRTSTLAAFNIQSASAGTMVLRATGAGAQGIQLQNSSNMTIFADIDGCVNSCIYLAGNSSGNRFPSARLVNASVGAGVQEAGTADNNRVSNARISATAGGVAVLLGAASQVTLEPAVGKAALTFGVPAAVPGWSSATATIPITGAAIGDDVRVKAPAATPANYQPVVGEVLAAGQVTVRYMQFSGAAAAAPSGTFAVHVIRRIVA